MPARGFSLIELMVTVAIMAFLLVTGLPLTLAWMADVHQRDAANTLAEGLSRAKAIALRNPAGQIDAGVPAAMLCMSGQRLYVPTSGDVASCADANPSWKASIPTGVAVVSSLDVQPLHCVAYNNRGIPLSVPITGSTCTTSSLNVTVGTQNALQVSIL